MGSLFALGCAAGPTDAGGAPPGEYELIAFNGHSIPAASGTVSLGVPDSVQGIACRDQVVNGSLVLTGGAAQRFVFQYSIANACTQTGPAFDFDGAYTQDGTALAFVVHQLTMPDYRFAGQLVSNHIVVVFPPDTLEFKPFP